MSKSSSSSSGTGFLTLLQILFIGLKLTGNIGWSWWYVMLPTTIPIGILLACLFIAGVALVTIQVLSMWGSK
jgi:hypothetical protein